MAGDDPIPLATPADMDQSTLRPLIAVLGPDEQRDLMVRATRACENHCKGRRLAPFGPITETHEAETAGPGMMGAGDVGALAAAGYRQAVGGGGGRQLWVDQYAPCYPDMWTYSGVAVEVLLGDGSSRPVATTSLGGGIDPGTGRLWFAAGLSMPVGTLVRVTYSGGYSVVPGDLVQACRLMAAADLVDEDSFPSSSSNSHDDETKEDDTDRGFRAAAHRLLGPYRTLR